MVTRGREIERVLRVTFLLNAGVAGAMLAVGWATHSLGIVSDGFHALFDGVSNVVGIVGIRMASAPPDREHPYGHGKYETLFSVLVGLMILATCAGILRRAVEGLAGGGAVVHVGPLSFAVMGGAVAVNIWVMLYEGRKGRELRSEFLVADARHTMTNVMASMAVVLGLVLTRAGHAWADAASGLVLSVFIARIGVQIIREASEVLVDRSALDAGEIEAVCCAVAGVRGCHAVRTRGNAARAAVDLHIELDAEITLREAHAITHAVSARIRETFPSVADVVVHTEPAGPSREER